MRKIRIVIADDHPIFMRGLLQVLSADPTLEIVAEARDGDAAFEYIQQHQPDVAILDIDMPKKDAFDVVRAMGDRNLSTAIVFLTMHKSEVLFNGAMDLGVRGYLLKDSALTEVVDGVKAVAAGHDFVSPLLTTFLLSRRKRSQQLLKEQTGLKDLTAAERRVLQLVARGKSTQDIARELFLSVRTVEHHRAHICGKLNLQGRDALLRFVVAHRSELAEQ
jgi:two-component system, NarL family, response regulator DegU